MRIVVAVVIVWILLAACGEGGREEFDLDALHVSDGLTLRYWMARPPRGASRVEMSEHAVYEELEKVTGVKIEFEYPISNDPTKQLEVLREADDLPDIIEWNWLLDYPGGADAALDEGMILPLRDLILQYAPNLLKKISGNEELMRAVTSRDGRFYAFPSLNIEPETQAFGGLMIRRKWIEQLGAPMPETINDWRNLLLSMREADFGTPGSGSEYPFFFPVFRSFQTGEITYYFLEESNAFAGTWGVSHGMYRDESGRVRYGPIQPGYRAMLTELNRWFEEGLIHPALAEPGGGGGFFTIVAKSGATLGVYDFLTFLEPIDYLRAPPPVLDDSDASLGSQRTSVYDGARSAAVAASSSNGIAAVRWLDVAYSDWGKRLFNYGIEGTSYTIEQGEPVLLDSVLGSYRRALGTTSKYSNDLMKYSRILFGGPFERSGRLLAQLRRREGDREVGEADPWLTGSWRPPETVFTYDAGRREEYRRLIGPIRRRARTGFAAFVTGRRPLAEFDDYVRDIEALGVADAISLIYNAEADFYTKTVF